MDINEAIEAINSGDLPRGRKIIEELLRIDASDAQCWIWLSKCFENREDKIKCLAMALQYDPSSRFAKSKMAKLLSDDSDVDEDSKFLSELRRRSEDAQANQSSNPIETQNLAWICPKCESRNMTPFQLRVSINLVCPQCREEYLCENGEVVWGEKQYEHAVWTEWFHWIVRLQQYDGSVKEVGFTLHTADFTIAIGDHLVVYIKKSKGYQIKAVQVENKTTGNIIRPGR
jgi:hypothetical protein